MVLDDDTRRNLVPLSSPIPRSSHEEGRRGRREHQDSGRRRVCTCVYGPNGPKGSSVSFILKGRTQRIFPPRDPILPLPGLEDYETTVVFWGQRKKGTGWTTQVGTERENEVPRQTVHSVSSYLEGV